MYVHNTVASPVGMIYQDKQAKDFLNLSFLFRSMFVVADEQMSGLGARVHVLTISLENQSAERQFKQESCQGGH